MDTPEHERPMLICNRCGAMWRQRKPHPPGKCPKCQSTRWHQPRPAASTALGPPPPKILDVTAPDSLLSAPTLPELRRVQVEIVEAAGWIANGSDLVARQARQVLADSRRNLDILEGLCNATQRFRMKPLLPPPQQTITVDVNQPSLGTAEIRKGVHKPASGAKRPRKPGKGRK